MPPRGDGNPPIHLPAVPLHLIRHGEVYNPGGIVYADLDGFGLSAAGHAQAEAAADHLGRSIDLIVSSPLQRAVETAAHLASAGSVGVVTDERLAEWALAARWAGTPWVDLPQLFPGELEAYASHPHDLPFSPESLAEVAARMEAALADAISGAKRHIVFVSHQDPIQALRLRLTGRPLSRLQEDKPVHAGVITLGRDEHSWAEAGSWHPATPSAPFPPLEQPDET